MICVIDTAVRESDHAELVKVANTSKFTSSFSSIMFSPEAAYDKGWIRKATLGENNNIVGLTCVRHKVREPKTVLYFLVVHPGVRFRHVGADLMADLEAGTPHKCVKFNVSKENPGARDFYEKLGYRVTSHEALKGHGWEMEKDWR